MSCEKIMIRNPRSLREDDTIGMAATEIVEHRCISLPVIDAQGRFVGLFGIFDLLALLVPRVAVIGNLLPNLQFLSDDDEQMRQKFATLRNSPVKRAINREAARVYPDTPLIEAIRLLCRNHLIIPVVEHDSERLIGVISYWNATQHIIGLASGVKS
jgi:CBS-domain-containing membrane protein